MHWRSLLRDSEKQLPSYNTSLWYTAQNLYGGLLEIFEIAGETSSLQYMNEDMIWHASQEVVKFAADLADLIKSNYYSANLDLAYIEPGAIFDGENMRNDGKNAGVVAGTVYLGLNKIGLDGEVAEVVVKPKVLLA